MEGSEEQVEQLNGPSEVAIAKRPDAAAIAAWKEKHGHLSQVEVDGYIAIVRRPKTFDLERAFKVSEKAGAKKLDFSRNIIANCVLYIDDEFRADDERDQALLTSVNELAAIKEASVKKL